MAEDLRRQNQALRKQLREARGETTRLTERLEQANRELRKRLEEAQRQTARRAAPFRREPRKKVPDERRKRPGRKVGHRGSYRPTPATIDERAEVPLEQCPHCAGPVTDCRRLEQIIEEVPPVRPHVVHVVSYRGRCARCGSVRSVHGRGEDAPEHGRRFDDTVNHLARRRPGGCRQGGQTGQIP